MRYKASITNSCLRVPLSIIVPHVFCLYMNFSMRTKQTEINIVLETRCEKGYVTATSYDVSLQ